MDPTGASNWTVGTLVTEDTPSLKVSAPSPYRYSPVFAGRAIKLVGFGHVLTIDLSPWACTRLMNIIKGVIGSGNQSVPGADPGI